MDEAEVRQKIREIISNVTNIPPEEITDGGRFREELDLDSLSLLEIGVDVDYEFRLGLPEEELQRIGSLDEAVALVVERSRRAAGEREGRSEVA
ncbi:MAG TPA: phosphopantetheine-binding protein [Thermoanaerobaculia bacterium]|jgi:acyl carrier protein|nr:phosphopantetheine-binding protein [Thermoanaerobaculia bacterium]